MSIVFKIKPCGTKKSPLWAGVVKKILTVWSLRVVGGDSMVQGSWVRDPLPVFFLLFFIPYERISCPGWGRRFHPLCLDPFPFLSLVFVHQPCSGGSSYSPNKKKERKKIYMGGWFGFNYWRVWGPALVLFLFYMNVSGMSPRSRLSSQPLTIPASWVILHVGRSILAIATLGDCLSFPCGE